MIRLEKKRHFIIFDTLSFRTRTKNIWAIDVLVEFQWYWISFDRITRAFFENIYRFTNYKMKTILLFRSGDRIKNAQTQWVACKQFAICLGVYYRAPNTTYSRWITVMTSSPRLLLLITSEINYRKWWSQIIKSILK